MSIVTILDKLGYITFNENYSTSDNLYGVTSPANSETIRSIINSYQLSQYIFNDLSETYPNSAKERTLSQGLEQFVSTVKEGKPVIFKFSYYSGSHAVVAFNWYVAPNGDYVVEVYDNYNSSQFVDMVIESDYSNAYFNNQQIRSIAFSNDYSCFMYHFDYDGNVNDNNTTYAPVATSYTNNDTIDIVVDGFCDYVVTNSEGKKLFFNDCNVTGDMELYDMNLIVSGPGHVEYKYTVNRSDSFTIDCDDGCCTVNIIG